MPMMALGLFVFALDPLPFLDLQRTADFRHPQQGRIGARQSSQNVGPGDETISLAGWIAPGQIGDRISLDVLREMGLQGQVWPLLDGTGVSHGAWKILNISESQSSFMDDGTPLRIDFTVNLRREDDGDAYQGGRSAAVAESS